MPSNPEKSTRRRYDRIRAYVENISESELLAIIGTIQMPTAPSLAGHIVRICRAQIAELRMRHRLGYSEANGHPPFTVDEDDMDK